MISTTMFQGRTLLIATMHEKQQVIAPILEKELGVKCLVCDDLNTDELGTFSGEIERKADPIATARNKCLKALEKSDCDLVVASEGSFGPHPTIYFVPADEEFLFFLDKKNDLEIIAKELSTETNFNAAEVKSDRELKDFVAKVNFPTHGLILRKSKDNYSDIVKGITDWSTLQMAFDELIGKHGKAYVETDMRAMYNPTRMKVIERAAVHLADKINSLCPNCQTPGFGITDAKPGLPCELCQFPTRSTLSYLYSCKKCQHEEEKKFPNNKLVENPMYCDFCNP